MQKIYFLVIFSILFIGCSKADDLESTNSNNNPVYDETYVNRIYDGLDIIPENDYSQLIATTEKESYTTDEVIKCHIINNNKGKGFSIYSHMSLEQKVNNEWERLDIDPTEYGEWLVIGEEKNREISNETYLQMTLSDIDENLSAGEYRLVIFTADKILYVPFMLDAD